MCHYSYSRLLFRDGNSDYFHDKTLVVYIVRRGVITAFLRAKITKTNEPSTDPCQMLSMSLKIYK